ncbi:MAG: TetR family transcriptional regulator [Actinomycetota bacterium]|nr:TetR family transcriptional regulator [Actinomycetota bacterium]
MTTRDRLLDEAEFLFARSSVAGVTSRQITEAAEQRNTSAISYHFGSREGLLLEILARRGAPIDEARGRRRDTLGAEPPLRDLVACLVEPYCAVLGTSEGRSYLRIVAQLRGRFAAWKVESDTSTTAHLSRILDEIVATCDASTAVRQERVLALIMVITGTTAERARRLDEDAEVALGHDEFVDQLTGICTAIIGG